MHIATCKIVEARVNGNVRIEDKFCKEFLFIFERYGEAYSDAFE